MNISLFTTFTGRINRKKFWLGMLVLLVVELVAGIVIGIVMLAAGYDLESPGANSAIDSYSTLFGIAFLLPAYALLAKRLHDRDKPVKWLLLSLIPVIGWFWLLVEAGFLKGTIGPNRFGNDPLAA